MMDYKKLFSQTKDLSLLLVEDYKPLCDEMEEVLEDLFDIVNVASDGSEALKLYQAYNTMYKTNYDIVITDIQMPVLNGIELTKRLRDIYVDQEIIVLSAHTDSVYLLELINLGISQFMIKPLKHEEMIDILYDVSKKINSIKSNSQNTHMLDLGKNYIWDQANLVLKQGADMIELTRHELLLMRLFVQKGEQICTNDDIMEDFYTHRIEISEKNIRNLVFKLRKKLPENVINSIYGMGYKFTPLHEI